MPDKPNPDSYRFSEDDQLPEIPEEFLKNHGEAMEGDEKNDPLMSSPADPDFDAGKFDLDSLSAQIDQISESVPWKNIEHPEETSESTAGRLPSTPSLDKKNTLRQQDSFERREPIGETSAPSLDAEKSGSKVSNFVTGTATGLASVVGATALSQLATSKSGSEKEDPTESEQIQGNPETTNPQEFLSDPKQTESGGVPFFAFLVLLTYASAITVACVYFMMQAWNGNRRELESLPDIKPPMKDGKVLYQLVPESRTMAAGHTVPLGISRRFGNILITPIGVTRGKLQFVHYNSDETQNREPVNDVLKLWLRFENVSKDQAIAPLDRELVLNRNPDLDQPDWLRSNNFVCQKSEKKEAAQKVLLYDLEIAGNWNFANIPDSKVLEPGESLDTYLPTEVVQMDQLSGPLVWRVHFRKGHNAVSGNGVTTLIEVDFDASQIRSEG